MRSSNHVDFPSENWRLTKVERVLMCSPLVASFRDVVTGKCIALSGILQDDEAPRS